MMNYLNEVISSLRVIFSLAITEFKQRYFSNNLGIAWAFIQPVSTILIMWFVFEIGFKSNPIDDVPFILWLSCGMIPWFMFADCLHQGLNSVMGNSFLVKKIVFNTRLLPIVSTISPLIIHLFFFLLLCGMFLVYGYSFSIYWMFALYYSFSLYILVLAISQITSSVVVFFKDMSQIVGLVVQFGFWLTPVFWSIQIVPEKYKTLVDLNPVVYAVEGYRDSFIYMKAPWEDIYRAAYFWFVVLVIALIGGKVFKKLSPHFSDVM
ncbi:ABC transporter permease [Vibrio cholerae]|uniref:ABC transporter permease n=2 Tax=Vibrio cholerae TaxID=666 RepID=UPI0018F0AF0D|nr:ABC transporter permease [Vibrio cholerae]